MLICNVRDTLLPFCRILRHRACLCIEVFHPFSFLRRIAQGRLDKFFKESTLVEQEFIKDNKMTVGAYAKANNATPTAFKRVTLNQD